MSKTKWTPGPWEADDDEQRITGIGRVHMLKVISPNSDVVVEFSNSCCNEIVYEDDGEGGGRHYDHQVMANARLIAAAPDLAEALEKLTNAYVKSIRMLGANDHGVASDAAVIAARAALAKARGAP